MPNIIIHALLNIILVYAIVNYEKYVLKKKYNLKNIILLVFSSHLIDLDHLFSQPIYDPARCSINSHFLHGWYMFPISLIGIIWSKYRYLFLAILFHLLLDFVDCLI